MKYYEVMAITYLQEDIHFKESSYRISKYISKAMALDEISLDRHLEKGFKHYVFSGLFPIEKEKVYKAGRIYIFRLNTLDYEFADLMNKNLSKAEDNYIKVVATQKKICNVSYINQIYTATPAVVTLEDKYWTIGDDIDLLEERMQSNLEKKYKDFYKKNINPIQKFASSMEIMNNKPIYYKYKNISILGNKFRIHINSDEISQELALIAVASGLLEKNSSLGMGFCLIK